MKVNVTGLNPYVNRFIVLSIALDDWEEASQCRAGGRVGRGNILALEFFKYVQLDSETANTVVFWAVAIMGVNKTESYALNQ